jgi:hypothetical protein
MSAKTRRPPVPAAVAEIQGLYGPFTFPENLLQKIWERRDFDAYHAATAGGQRVRIEHTGNWNHLGGPDFKNARLCIGENKLAGDVEVHLRESDWDAHRHTNDPAYANVILHVVLFPPRRDATPGANARDIPVLSLLPLLHHDLEQYAADDAIEHLAAHSLSRASKTLSTLAHDELRATLAHHAEKRWRQKIHFARQRVGKLGWDEACHHAALEILGYSRNRAAMLDVAGKYPLRAWGDPAGSADAVFAAQQEAHAWAPQATRPANHPRTRLHQYAAWVSARPAWPRSLPVFAKYFSAGGDPASGAVSPGVAAWRRDNKSAGLRKRICSEICGNALGGTRLDTFVCDGLLPLLAARNAPDAAALGVAWRNWFVGDMPAHFAKQLRALGVTGTRTTPAHNGAAQGLLGFLLEEETNR